MWKKIIEKIIPRDILSLQPGQHFFSKSPHYDLSALQQAISIPTWDLIDRGGKQWRPQLCLSIARCLKPNGKIQQEDVLKQICATLEVIHNGSLMVDDQQDKSQLRRGDICTYKKFGEAISINCANALYFVPINSILQHNSISDKMKLEIFQKYITECINMHVGQAMDIYWSNHKIIPNIDQYLEMNAAKTGSMSRMAAHIACIWTKQYKYQDVLVQQCTRLGTAFQIIDDLINLTSEQYAKQKGFLGDDIFEGKRSLMAIHCYQKLEDPHKQRFLEIIDMQTKNKELIAEATSMMVKTKSLLYSKEVAQQLLKEFKETTYKIFAESEEKKQFMDFVQSLVDREI